MLRIDQIKVASQPPLTFSVPGGECLAVEGPSGCGKTRLLRAIADLDVAPGYAFLDGAERREMRPEVWRRGVRYVAAEPGWWATTAGEHIRETPRIARLLPLLGLEARHLTSPLVDLSTGERQRLALIRALADEPRALLLDEPTAALDKTTAALVDELIRFECLAGRSIVLVSHDAGQIERLAHVRLQLGPSREASASSGDGPNARVMT